MAPTYRPGDRLLLVGLPPRWLRPGHVVVVARGAAPLVKRVVDVDPVAGVFVEGDNRGASTDSRDFGPVDPDAVLGRVVWRYHREP